VHARYITRRRAAKKTPIFFTESLSHIIIPFIIITLFQSFFGGLGSGGLQIKIALHGTPDTHPHSIFYSRHRPSWKVRKNVFTVLKNINSASGSPARTSNSNNNRIMVYSCDHETEGSITLSMSHGKKLDHLGILVKFFGRIDMVSFFTLIVTVCRC